MPEVFIKAHDALFTRARLQKWKRVLVHAAGSGVGTAAVPLARVAGATVYGTSRTAEKLRQVRALGLDESITAGQSPQEFVESVHKLTGGDGVEVILDLVGGAYFPANLQALATRGRLICVGTTAGRKSEIDLGLVLRKRATIIGTVLRARSIEEKAEATRCFSDHVLPLVSRGVVRPMIDQVYPAEEVRAAHQHVESNRSCGKVVLDFPCRGGRLLAKAFGVSPATQPVLFACTPAPCGRRGCHYNVGKWHLSCFLVIMAKFLNTSAANYYLEEIIRLAHDRLILISPFLKLNERIKELLEDKNRLKIDIRIVYGKNELQPEEMNWLRALSFIRTSYCKNLHAKCYLNEQFGIVTSLNLYEFNQVNNNEMGILILRADDPELFEAASDEAQRIIRISDEVRMSFEKVKRMSEDNAPEADEEQEGVGKLSTSRLAKKLGLKTQELTNHLVSLGAIEISDGQKQITPLGRRLGGELRVSARFGPYFLWPEALPLAKV